MQQQTYKIFFWSFCLLLSYFTHKLPQWVGVGERNPRRLACPEAIKALACRRSRIGALFLWRKGRSGVDEWGVTATALNGSLGLYAHTHSSLAQSRTKGPKSENGF